jgi:hypothetical protein
LPGLISAANLGIVARSRDTGSRVPVRAQPRLTSINQWFNSPLGRGLLGKVVLVDFWTMAASTIALPPWSPQ